MMKEIVNQILRKQEPVPRGVGQFTMDTLRARVFQTQARAGSLEYWIDVQWTVHGQECSSYGLLRRSSLDLPFDVMREAHSYLRTLPR